MDDYKCFSSEDIIEFHEPRLFLMNHINELSILIRYGNNGNIHVTFLNSSFNDNKIEMNYVTIKTFD